MQRRGMGGGEPSRRNKLGLVDQRVPRNLGQLAVCRPFKPGFGGEVRTEAIQMFNCWFSRL